MDDCQKIILDCQRGVVFISISSNASWRYMCTKDLLPTAKFILKQINNFNIQHLGAQLRHMRHTKHRTKLVKKLWWQNTWKSEDHEITGNIPLLYVQCNRFWNQYISPEKHQVSLIEEYYQRRANNLFSIDFVPQESDFSLESKQERYPLQPFVQRESAMKLPVSFGNDTCLIARFHKSKSLLFNKRLQNHEFHLGTLSGETRFRIFCRRGSCFSNCQHCFSLINLRVQLWLWCTNDSREMWL